MKLSRRRALMAATAATLLEAPAFAATPKSQTTTNSWDRTCDVLVAGGGAVMKGLIRALKATEGIEVMTSTRLTAVIKNEGEDAVAGVEAVQGDRTMRIKTKSLVLATGGFGRNQDDVERFANQWAGTGRIMDVCDLGDGLRIATELGAGARNLEICMVCPTLETTRNVFLPLRSSTAPSSSTKRAAGSRTST